MNNEKREAVKRKDEPQTSTSGVDESPKHQTPKPVEEPAEDSDRKSNEKEE